MMLEVKDLCVSYGAIKAVRGISFYVDEGEIITLIGANGAGKTTTLNSISNIIKKQSGSIFFNGNDITAVHPDKIVRQNLIQVPEGRRIFANLTVLENLELGAYLRKDKDGIERDMERVFGFFPRLKERTPSVKETAATAPTRASGTFKKAIDAARAEPRAKTRMKNIATTKPAPRKSNLPSALSRAS